MSKTKIEDNDIKYGHSPAESPDMNSTKLLWKRSCVALSSQTNKDELEAGIHRFWDSGTAAECGKYISHLRKVNSVVVQREGRASGLLTASFNEKTAPFAKVLDYHVDWPKHRRFTRVCESKTNLNYMYTAFNFSHHFYEQFGEHRSMIWQILTQEANPVSHKNLYVSKNKT